MEVLQSTARLTSTRKFVAVALIVLSHHKRAGGTTYHSSGCIKKRGPAIFHNVLHTSSKGKLTKSSSIYATFLYLFFWDLTKFAEDELK